MLNNGHKKRLFLLCVITFFLQVTACKAQLNVNSASCCYAKSKHLIQESSGYNNLKDLLHIEKNMLFGDGFIVTDTSTISPIYSFREKKIMPLASNEYEIDDWLDIVIWDSVQFYLEPGNRYLIGVSPIKNVTGFSVNFKEVIIIDLMLKYFYLSQNIFDAPIYFGSNLGSNKSIFLFDYSNKFLENMDVEKLSMELNKYSFEKDNLRLEKNWFLDCSCLKGSKK